MAGCVSAGPVYYCMLLWERAGENKEIPVLIENYDLIRITETWLDSSRAWSAAANGYRPSRKDSPGQQGEGVTLDGREQWECMERYLGASDDPVESLWVRIRGQSNIGYVVGVCYQLPDQVSL